MQHKTNLILVSFLLLLLVGPCFGPIPRYLTAHMALRSAAGWLMLAFFIAMLLVLVITRRRMQRQGQTLADLGWGQPSTWLAILLGTLMGVLWGTFGIMGFLQFNAAADPFEVSLFRVFTGIAGALIAIGEDLVTRGYVMNELRDMSLSTGWQILLSSLLFALYHSLWGFSAPGFVASLVYGAILSGLFVLGKRSLTPVILAHSLALLIGEPFLTMSLLRAVQMGG